MRDEIGRSCLAVLVGLALLIGCDANLGSVASSDSGTEGGESSTTGDHEPIACIGGELCPSQTRCSNGLCVAECSGEPDCTDQEYCGADELCHANTVPTCNSDEDCAGTQTCVDQFCTTLGEGGCNLDDYLQDGCPSNALCIEDLDTEGLGFCHEMPACAADQTCPLGLEGAVCNTGQLLTKDQICLVGLCEVPDHCPSLWSCVHYNNSVLGLCSNGGFGSPCSEAGHCLSSNCVPVPGLGGGFCG